MTIEKRYEIFEAFSEGFFTEEAVKWLKMNGYFTAPASSKYHLAYEGGLFEHCSNVALNLIFLTNKLDLKWEREESPWLIGLLHDVCKVDQYIWDPILKKYTWNKDQVVLGHGDKSITYIEEHICKLTEEEKACIRWHMGAFDEKENWSRYTAAIHEYPNVLWTHSADMMASHIVEQRSQSEGNKNGVNS